MSKTPAQLQDISVAQQLDVSDIVYLPKISAPFTTVVNRAKMVDLANDMSVRMGIDRIMTQQIMKVDDEVGPNGETVWKPVNDKFDQIRFVGSWGQENSSVGQSINTTPNSSNYVEVSFYGTGLNMLSAYIDGSNRSVAVAYDGGSEVIINRVGSSIISARNYTANITTSLVSGLTLGIHTVKIRSNVALDTSFTGFEILNEQFLTTTANTNSSTSLTSVANTTGLVVGMDITGTGIPANTTISAISGNTITMSAAATATASGVSVKFGQNFLKVVPGISYSGGKKLTKTAVEAIDYKTGFESGTLGTRGGHVVVYQKKDNTIGKAVTPTDATALYMTNASHTNEEVIRAYHIREFGVGRTTDDFSTNPTAPRSFTLDDGTTTLSGTSCAVQTTVTDKAYNTVNGATITFTFVGTGLDIMRIDTQNLAGTDTFSYSIDGAVVGTVSGTGIQALRREKICSGLPYGTHTFVLTRTSAPNQWDVAVAGFVVYGPKKPTIPTGAVELADYFVMGDYVAGVVGLNNIATGVLRKHTASRETVFVNGTGGSNFVISTGVGTNIGGFYTYSNHLNSYFEYTFFGTGFELRGSADTIESSNIAVTLNGSAATTANFPSLVSGVYGGYSFSSGVLSMNAALTRGAGLRITGLPLGKYTVRFNQSAAASASTYLFAEALDIITPIHTPKMNGPFTVQNTLSVGSQGISDNRKFGSQLPFSRNISQAVGITGTPTTTSATNFPVPDMSVCIKTNGNPIRIAYTVNTANTSTPAATRTIIMVDGFQAGMEKYNRTAFNAQDLAQSDSIILPVSAGWHKVDVYWSASGATSSSGGQDRNLTVEELPMA